MRWREREREGVGALLFLDGGRWAGGGCRKSVWLAEQLFTYLTLSLSLSPYCFVFCGDDRGKLYCSESVSIGALGRGERTDTHKRHFLNDRSLRAQPHPTPFFLFLCL